MDEFDAAHIQPRVGWLASKNLIGRANSLPAMTFADFS
jgi:hypothetical protein